jgi:hypothetical protein
MPTFTLIASSTVGSGGAASIDFTSIPSTYTDLCVKLSGRANNGTDAFIQAELRFNSDSSTIYSNKRLRGNGSAAASTQGSSNNSIPLVLLPASAATSNTFSNVEIYVPNYAGSANKSLSCDSVSENNATESYQYLVAGLWASTAAITSISLIAANFVQYSTAYLYGVSNA